MKPHPAKSFTTGKLSEPFVISEHGSPSRLLPVTNDLHNGRGLHYERGREPG